MTRAAALVLMMGAASSTRALSSDTARFSFVSDPVAASAVVQLEATAEQDRTATALELGSDYDGRTTVHVVMDRSAFDALQPADAAVPGWIHATFNASRNEIVVLAGNGIREAFQGALFAVAAGRLSQGRIPLWMLAGRAVVMAGNAWELQGPSLVRADRADALFPLDDLAVSFPTRPADAALAWAESASIVHFIQERSGPSAIPEIVKRTASGASFENAVFGAVGISLRKIQNEWEHGRMKWITAMDLLTDGRTIWGLAIALLLLAFWRAQRRKKLRIKLLAFEEKAEEARKLLRTPAAWADEPREPRPSTDKPVANPRTVPSEEEGSELPKKPTLH